MFNVKYHHDFRITPLLKIFHINFVKFPILNRYDEPHALDEIKLKLNKKPGNLLRSLNELIDKKLVVKSDKKYFLSSAGHLLAMNIINLFDNRKSIDNHFDFWQKHSINTFTSKFIKRIGIWETAELIESDTIEFVEPPCPKRGQGFLNFFSLNRLIKYFSGYPR